MFITNRNLKKFLLIFLMVVFVFLNVSCNELNNDSSLTVFKNVNIIPMNTETILEGYNVVIKDGKIVKIGKPWKTRAPKNSMVIDGKSKYLVPGLTDMHVHWLQGDDELTLYLANGITTIRDMFGNYGKLGHRERIEEGEILGPRLYISTPLIDGEQPIWSGSLVVTNPEDVEPLIANSKKMGYDFIKVYEKLTMDVYDSIVKVAKKENIPVVGHVPSLVGIEKVIKSGQKSIEHLSRYYDSDELYDMTIENNVWNCPTIVVYSNFNRSLAEEKIEGLEYIHPLIIRTWEGGMNMGSSMIETSGLKHIAKRLHDKGGKILLGTDTNNPFIVPGFSIHDELYNFVDIGLTPYEALRTGTYNAAEFLNILDESGTVETGKNADLILLDGNPLEDITNMKKIEGVMIRGKWISKSEIDEMLKTIAESVE
jgi:imidazolonepropionase-like amidohydrolase